MTTEYWSASSRRWISCATWRRWDEAGVGRTSSPPLRGHHKRRTGSPPYARRSRLHPPHSMVLAVGDVQHPLVIDDAAVRPAHAGLQRVAAVAARPLLPAGHRDHFAVLHEDLPHRLI